jgi:hypothetical protein
MEMAMFGAPVIVSGATHYRGRGFTHDPESWVAYFKLLGQILANPSDFRLSRPQVESAWEYAYRFFFEYPRPFPWHLVRVWEDYKTRPLNVVCGPEGLEQYGETFRYLVGEPINWSAILKSNGHVSTEAAEQPSAPDGATADSQKEETQLRIPPTGRSRTSTSENGSKADAQKSAVRAAARRAKERKSPGSRPGAK